MSTINPPGHISKRQELREDRVITFYARAWEFFDRNRALVYGALGLVVLLVVGIVAYVLYQQSQDEEAQQLLGQVLPLYESESYQAALDGAEGQPGLLEIAEEYGGTDAGNIARLYAADALFQIGEHDRALEFFEAFDREEGIIGASAYAGEAAVHENQGNFERAGDLYLRAAEFFENELTTPRYLFEAAQAYEQAGDVEAAREAYTTIRQEYPESQEAADIDKYLARIEARQ